MDLINKILESIDNAKLKIDYLSRVVVEHDNNKIIISDYDKEIRFHKNGLICTKDIFSYKYSFYLEELINLLIEENKILGWIEFDSQYIGWFNDGNEAKCYFNLSNHQNNILLDKINEVDKRIEYIQSQERDPMDE